jgi:hypothetical protein
VKNLEFEVSQIIYPRLPSNARVFIRSVLDKNYKCRVYSMTVTTRNGKGDYFVRRRVYGELPASRIAGDLLYCYLNRRPNV